MFSYEIKNYLLDRNYRLAYHEFLFISDTTIHPQIVHIKYIGDQKICMETNDNYKFIFTIKGEYI